MRFDEIFDLTAGVYFNFYNIYIYIVTTALSCRYLPLRGFFLQNNIAVLLKLPRLQAECDVQCDTIFMLYLVVTNQEMPHLARQLLKCTNQCRATSHVRRLLRLVARDAGGKVVGYSTGTKIAG